VKIEFVVFWVVALCNVVVGHKHFRGSCCLCLQHSTPVLQNVGIHPPSETAQP